MRPQVGNVIHNKYRLLRLIGDGGMGSVFEARHEVLGTTVALKFLHVELARRPGLVQRFLQEARVSAQIQSPNVVRVTDVDQTSTGLAFIVMELLEGKTLQSLYEELYRAGQRLSYADALEYAMQMLEGLAAAHRAGIVHRDLKPDNVMITRSSKGEPVIKLLDFGIAKLKVTGQLEKGLTRPGVIMGTPEYMAPEQAYSADAVDSRADIFSLGVIIFEMLAGRRPVGGDEPQQIASAYLAGQVAELTELFPECPYDLATAVHKAMAPLAKDRFPSADAMRGAIEPFWAAIRPPPPSMQASIASLSFARLTPAPSTPPGAMTPSRRDGGRGTVPLPASAALAPQAIELPPVVASVPIPDGGSAAKPRGAPQREPETAARAEAKRVEDERPTPLTPPPQMPVAPVAGSSSVAETAAGEPPVDSSVPSRQPTPLGGFRDNAKTDNTAIKAAAKLDPTAAMATDPTVAMPVSAAPAAAPAVAAKAPAREAGTVADAAVARAPAVKASPSGSQAIPATAAPLEPKVAAAEAKPARAAAKPINGAGTAEAKPLFTAGGLGAGTAEAAPLGLEATPQDEPELGAGTVAMDEPYTGQSGQTSAPTETRAGEALGMAAADRFGAASVDPLATPAPPRAAAPRPTSKKRGRGASIAIVLMLASGITAAVIGGVWAAQGLSHGADREDTRAAAAAPRRVRAEPPPLQEPPPPVAEPTAPPPMAAPPPQPGHAPPRAGRPTRPAAPSFPGAPNGPGGPRTVPSGGPSTAPPSLPPLPPSPLPPFIIPSNLPFPFPGQAAPQAPPRASGGDPQRRGPLVPIPRPDMGGDPYFRTNR